MAGRQAFAGSNTSALKSHNVRAILLALLRHSAISRVRLAELTGLSSTTVTNLIGELLEQRVVVEGGVEQPKQRRGAGRPRRALCLVPEARHAIGMHMGVGSIRVVVTDLRARPLCYLDMAHPVEESPEAVLHEATALIDRAVEESEVDPGKVVGIGVGASGLVDPSSGINVLAPNLGWRDVPFRELIGKRLDHPVLVDNNVRAMALAEAMFGGGQDCAVLAFVYARIGVGAGLVVDGRLFRGGGAGAGEIGHMTIIADQGERCRCGNTGCLETLVSEPVIVGLARGLAQQYPDGILARFLQEDGGDPLEQVFSAACAGDRHTQAMLEERACYMGIALANLVNIFNPELIVLGGILDQGQHHFLPIMEATMRQRAFANLGRQVRLQPTTFGRQAGAIGAAALALDAFFYGRE